MTSQTFEETIRERIEAVELVVGLIAEEGKDSNLHDLRVLLIAIMGMLKRDPGIESAADDLYAAATMLVRDNATGFQPMARKLRLLKNARERFCNRLPGAVACGNGDEVPRYRGLEAAYAVQLERQSVSAPILPWMARSAA